MIRRADRVAERLAPQHPARAGRVDRVEDHLPDIRPEQVDIVVAGDDRDRVAVFHEAPQGGLQVAQIPWDSEAHYQLPASTWKDLIDLYYPNSAWLCLRLDVFDLLQQHKVRRGIPTWEETLEELLAAAQEAISP